MTRTARSCGVVTGTATQLVERDDGLVTVGTASRYFEEYTQWPACEQKAARLARGRVLDIGCGAGRVALYLGSRGCTVTPIDNSPLAVGICKERGLSNAILCPVERVRQFPDSTFDTVVMFGNNLGLLGSRAKGRRLLRRLYEITSPTARILGETVDPHDTRNPFHRRYHRWNRSRNRMPGQLRIRIRHEGFIGPWFDYLLLSRNELRNLIRGTGWKVEAFIADERLYVAVLVKTSRRGPRKALPGSSVPVAVK